MKRKKKIKKIKDAVLRIRFEIMKIERSKKKKKNGVNARNLEKERKKIREKKRK